MDFRSATQQYKELISQLHSGRLTPQQFAEAVNALRLQTEDGAWWQINAQNGAWMRWNGVTWEQVPTPQTSKPKKKRSRATSCLLIIAAGFLALLCGLALVGAVGYYLISSGRITTMQILSSLGPGMGEIQIFNIADDTMEARLVRLDTEDGNPETIDSLSIEPLLINGFGAVEAGLYQVEFNFLSGAPAGGTCSLKVRRGEFYQFISVPEGIGVILNEEVPDIGADMNILQSPLCRQ